MWKKGLLFNREKIKANLMKERGKQRENESDRQGQNEREREGESGRQMERVIE